MIEASIGEEDCPLLSVRDLRVVYRGRSTKTAVDNVSFDVHHGRTLGLVGESGCGKSSVARAVLGLVEFEAGSIRFDGHPIDHSDRSLRRRMQVVFQDPMGSLNPRMRVGAIVGEPLLVHQVAKGQALRDKVAALLESCGLPADAASRYPHAFSGGQRQRIGIARAIALEPDLIICDEPTSALDVSVQAQILNLLKDLQRDRGIAYLFISHDMAVIDHMCDDVIVMKDGCIVEGGPRNRILDEPQEAYTRRLLDAVPRVAMSAVPGEAG